MTPEQESLILRLADVPGQEDRRPSHPELLAAFDAEDGRTLCLDRLRRAVDERRGVDVELVLMMARQFGMDRSFLPVLRALSREPWHIEHEDISRHLENLGGADVVDDLAFLAWAGPEYRAYEGSTALASKAVHSLERIATPEARAEIVRLRQHPAPVIRALVKRVERRMDPA